MKIRAEVQIEVQSADDIELWDYTLPDDIDDGLVIDAVEELNMGDVFPLDENDVIIEPEHGIHEMVLEFDTENDTIAVISSEVVEKY